MEEAKTTYKDFLQPRDAWDALSMKEKAEMIGVAVRNGITNLNDIRDRYNEFAEGGSVDTDWSYNSWKRQIAEHMGIRPDEDNTYDYEAYFKKYPEEAWKMLKGDPTAHFSDEFKTVYHPTFSSKSIGNDGSIYSGVRNPKTNPQGLVGGTWSPDYHIFTMSPDGYRGPVGMDDRKWYLENAEDNGVQLREADGSLPIYDGIPWGGVLPNVTIYGNRHSLGGPLVEAAMNEYKKGGSIHIAPSKRGTFTAAAKKHGKSVQAFASQVLAHPENYSPAMRKKANFARNASHWKHGLGGNLFEEGGEQTDAFTPIKNPIIPKVKGDQEAVNWIANWYNNRREQLYNNMRDYDSGHTLLYNIKGALLGYPEGRLAINHDYYNKLNKMADYKVAPFEDLKKDDPEDYERQMIDVNKGTKIYGYTHPKTKKTYYNDQFFTGKENKQEGHSLMGTHIHERTHTTDNVGSDMHFMFNTPQIKATESIIKVHPWIPRDDYLDHPTEMYSRMMEFRYNHNMDPNKKYSEEEVQEMLDQENLDGMNSRLHRYDLESLTKALNEVAQSNNKLNNLIV